MNNYQRVPVCSMTLRGRLRDMDHGKYLEGCREGEAAEER